MCTTNTPCFCHLIMKNLKIWEEHSVHSVENQIFLCLKKFKLIYVYNYKKFSKKILNLVICSGEIESFEITSLNISSTLNLVESINFFLLPI